MPSPYSPAVAFDVISGVALGARRGLTLDAAAANTLPPLPDVFSAFVATDYFWTRHACATHVVSVDAATAAAGPRRQGWLRRG